MLLSLLLVLFAAIGVWLKANWLALWLVVCMSSADHNILSYCLEFECRQTVFWNIGVERFTTVFEYLLLSEFRTVDFGRILVSLQLNNFVQFLFPVNVMHRLHINSPPMAIFEINAILYFAIKAMHHQTTYMHFSMLYLPPAWHIHNVFVICSHECVCLCFNNLSGY